MKRISLLALSTVAVFAVGFVISEAVAQSGPVPTPYPNVAKTDAKAIPGWVDNNFRWYAEGAINQSDLLNSLSFLLDNGHMHLSDKAAKEMQELRDENAALKKKLQADGISGPKTKDKAGDMRHGEEIYTDEYGMTKPRMHGDSKPDVLRMMMDAFGLNPHLKTKIVQYDEKHDDWIDVVSIDWSQMHKMSGACPKHLAPVCGIDGNTYSNSCLADAHNVDIAHEGECGAGKCDIACLVYDPVCGENGVTYSCGVAEAECHGVEIAHAGECDDTPQYCPQHYAPVCGTDGKTYSNDCFADVANADIAHKGECEDVQVACPLHYAPVCGVDGNTYGNSCQAESSGVEIAYEGECIACPDVWAPVCGTDGQTYGNECEAKRANADIAHEGECRPAIRAEPAQ